MNKFDSYLNTFIGLGALATNIIVIKFFGLDLYGTFALVLLCQSFGSIFFDLGYSNIIVQQRSLATKELKKLELLANAAVITLVSISFIVLSDATTILNVSMLCFWSVCSVRASRNVALLQREKKITVIIFGDGLQVLIFLMLVSTGAKIAPLFELDILSYLLLSQLAAQMTRAIYTQSNLVKSNLGGNFSLYETKSLALSQVIDRSTRLIVSKGEQIIFTMLFTGSELGFVLFLSNVSVQFFSRLSSPQTRYLVALSKDVSEIDLLNSVKKSYNKYLITVCVIPLFVAALLFFGSHFTVQLQQALTLAVESKETIFLIAVISILRVDMDFYLAWLICVRKYYIVPVFNFIVGVLLLLLIFIFVKMSVILGIFVGFLIAYGFGLFEKFIRFESRFWLNKILILSLFVALSIYWLL